jgi:hypothetical protein
MTMPLDVQVSAEQSFLLAAQDATSEHASIKSPRTKQPMVFFVLMVKASSSKIVRTSAKQQNFRRQ